MIETLKALIDSLRQELQQYGEMLARLDQQQESILRRAGDDLVATVALIQDQTAVLQAARAERDYHQRQLALTQRLPEHTTLASLVPHLPPDYRPLMSALVEENNALLVRVQQRARQNHVLLHRSMELMQNLMNSLVVPAPRGLYNGSGVPANSDARACLLCDTAA